MLRVLLVDNDSAFLERMHDFPWLAHQCECIGVAQSGEQCATSAPVSPRCRSSF